MPASMPPLAARIIAARRSVCVRAAFAAWPPWPHRPASWAKPCGSRNAAMALDRSASYPAVSSQASEGRTMSPQTATVSAQGTSLACPPRQLSHWPGSRSHPAPAASAPLASQRCCQLPPSWACSQSSRPSRPPGLRPG